MSKEQTAKETKELLKKEYIESKTKDWNSETKETWMPFVEHDFEEWYKGYEYATLKLQEKDIYISRLETENKRSSEIYKGVINDLQNGIEDQVKEIERLKGEKWIRVEDSLPDEKTNVLLLVQRDNKNDDSVIKGWYEKFYNSFMSSELHEDEDIFPTHWQPLPPKPIN